MGMKFNPFTGKLDIVGLSEERFAELCEIESTIDEGEMFKTHGGFTIPSGQQSYNFGLEDESGNKPNAMTVKEILKKVLLEKIRAAITAEGDFNQFVNIPRNCTPVFNITRKSYPITKIVVTVKDSTNAVIETLTLDKATQSYKDGGGNDLDMASITLSTSPAALFNADGNMAVSNLRIAMPTRTIQADHTWICTIYENIANDGETPNIATQQKNVNARFYYPKLVIMADYAKIKSDHAEKIALRYTSSTQKLSVKRMPDGEGYYAVGDFRGGEQNTATFTLTGTKLFGDPNKIDFNTGETLCILCKDRQVNQNWENSFGGIKDWEKGLPMQGGMVERTPQVSIYLDDATDPIVAGGSVHWHLFFIDTSYNAGSQPFEVNFK